MITGNFDHEKKVIDKYWLKYKWPYTTSIRKRGVKPFKKGDWIRFTRISQPLHQVLHEVIHVETYENFSEGIKYGYDVLLLKRIFNGGQA